MIISFLVFVFALFLVLGAYLLATASTDQKRTRLQKRLSEALMHSAHTEDVDVVLARAELMSEIPAVNRTLVNIQAALQLKRMLDQADLHITPSRLLMFSFMAGMLGALAASVLTIFIPIMIFAGLCCAAVPFVHVWWKRRQRFNKFLENLPDALDLVSRALSAGHAFSEALHMVSIEMPEPIATEFRKAYEEQNLGLSIKQRETGGNLAEILEKVGYTIRERFRIMGDLKTLTTSSRMSAWLLCALPIAVALMVTVMNPDYMSVLWKDQRGHYLIAIALFMQITGMLIVRKILNIKI
jgi:tight adherence protein B